MTQARSRNRPFATRIGRRADDRLACRFSATRLRSTISGQWMARPPLHSARAATRYSRQGSTLMYSPALNIVECCVKWTLVPGVSAT